MITVRLATSSTPGAVAVIELYDAADGLLSELSGLACMWSIGRLRYAQLAGIDDGLIGRVSDRLTHVYPHGGPRVVQRLITWCMERGAEPAQAVDARAAYPEAQSDTEAQALSLIARATSPAAVDLLLAEPSRWVAAAHQINDLQNADAADAQVIKHLLTPPMVVVAGAPNAGKSTLLNRLVGRTAAAVSETPGTTRDYVAQLVELASPMGGVTVRWLDTPGVRESSDDIEQQAIGIAAKVIEQADVLIALREPSGAWPELSREPDLWVINKADQGDERLPAGAMAVSARTGEGVSQLLEKVARRLGLVI